MTHADGRRPGPRGQAPARPAAPAPARDDPATAAASAAAAAPATGSPKGGGKKAAAAGGDDSPPDGSALPPLDAQLAAAANLLIPVAPPTAAPAASAPVGGSLAATLAAPAAAPAAGVAAPTDAALNPPPPGAGAGIDPIAAPPERPPAAPRPVAMAGEFRAVTDGGGTARAPALPAAPAPSPAPAALPVAATVVPAAPPVVTRRRGLGCPDDAVDGDTGRHRGRSGRRRHGAGADAGARDRHGQSHGGRGGSGDGSTDAGRQRRDPGPLAAAAPATASSSPAVAQVATPVGSPDWPAQLGDRVAVLVNQNLTNAQIKLSPPHLGPLEIRIALSDGQANIAFTTHSQVTREALEAAAPKLRELLSGQGFATVNVDVSQQQFRDRGARVAALRAGILLRGRRRGRAAGDGGDAAGPRRRGRTQARRLRLSPPQRRGASLAGASGMSRTKA